MSERLHTITNPDKLDTSFKLLLVEAHRDDSSMAGVDVPLAKRGAGITTLVLTDGAARNREEVSEEEMRLVRQVEGPVSAKVAGAAKLIQADLPYDGVLINHMEEARNILGSVIEEEKPDALITPNKGDGHFDHAATGLIADRFSLPVYQMDTISGYDRYGNVINPTHYIEMTRGDVRRRKRAHNANESQVINLPWTERMDLHEVYRMPKRRGQDIEAKFAGAVLLEDASHGDPIAEFMGHEVKIFEKIG
jgi:LmbE family N-acetylglucosaminyl deacetylase